MRSRGRLPISMKEDLVVAHHHQHHADRTGENEQVLAHLFGSLQVG